MAVIEKPKILIVDDNPFNRELILEVAVGQGFEVEEAKNGKDALAKVEATDFDLIMLDLLMPVMDGFETAKKIREMGITTPIVAVSALSLKQDRVRSLEAGCSDFLPKPLNIKKLKAILLAHARQDPDAQKKIRSAGKEKSTEEKEFILEIELFKGKTLVLVEEDLVLRSRYDAWLASAGFNVHALENGSEALAFVQDPKNKVSIVIGNIFTSGIDGLGLLTIVKREFNHILVVLYTQSYDTTTFQYAVHQGVDGIIPQDQFEASALEIIESALAQSKLNRVRAAQAVTASQVRKAQAQLIRPGCINACPFLDVAYRTLHEAGGDMMRCRRLSMDGHCGIVLADVAGHDVMSSYTSAIFTGILTACWDSNPAPMELLKKINHELIKVGNDKSHICLTAMVWDRWNSTLEIASAGNPGPLKVTLDKNGDNVYTDIAGGGMVLGALEENDLFIHESLTFDPQTRVFLFSDGIETNDLIEALEALEVHAANEANVANAIHGGERKKDLSKPEPIKRICPELLEIICDKKEPDDDLILLGMYDTQIFKKADFRAEFLSTYEEVDRACLWVEENIPKDLTPWVDDIDLVFMALREAFLNAVELGNRQKPGSRFEVAILVESEKSQLKIIIADEGRGFDFDSKVIKPGEFTSEQIGKRGLGLMVSVADKIVVNGGTITLIF
jgi:CheY-like chemotaxis protein/anti-sigma regulatory factor (Ser/Thr protein kinase)